MKETDEPVAQATRLYGKVERRLAAKICLVIWVREMNGARSSISDQAQDRILAENRTGVEDCSVMVGGPQWHRATVLFLPHSDGRLAQRHGPGLEVHVNRDRRGNM